MTMLFIGLVEDGEMGEDDLPKVGD